AGELSVFALERVLGTARGHAADVSRALRDASLGAVRALRVTATARVALRFGDDAAFELLARGRAEGRASGAASRQRGRLFAIPRGAHLTARRARGTGRSLVTGGAGRARGARGARGPGRRLVTGAAGRARRARGTGRGLVTHGPGRARRA